MIAASVIGVIQLTSTVAQACFDYFTQVGGARKAAQRMKNQLAALQIVLEKLEEVANDCNDQSGSQSLPQKKLDALGDLLAQCTTELEKLEKKLKKPIGWKGSLMWPLKEKEMERTLQYLSGIRDSISQVIEM